MRIRTVPLVFMMAFLLIQALPYISSVSEEEEAYSIDVDRLNILWTYERPDSKATLWEIDWSPDQANIAAVYFDHHVDIVNSTTGELQHSIKVEDTMTTRCDGYLPYGTSWATRVVRYSPDGNSLAVGGEDSNIYVYDTADYSLKSVLRDHKGGVLSLAWSHDSQFLVSGSGRERINGSGVGENKSIVWDMNTLQPVTEFLLHEDAILSIRYSPDGKMVATASDDKTIRVWWPNNGTQYRLLKGHSQGVLDVGFAPNGTWMISGSRDYYARVWNLTGGFEIQKVQDANCDRSVDWHPGGDLIMAGGVAKTMKIMDAANRKTLRSYNDGIDLGGMYMSCRWSKDGQRLACGMGKSHAVLMYGDKAPPPEPLNIPWLGMLVFGGGLIVAAGIIAIPLKMKIDSRKH